MSAPVDAFTRDRLTVLSYASLGTYAYCLYGLGPLLTLLRNDLNLSYALMSLHSVVFAAGALMTGASFSALCKRTGRRRLFWISAAGTATGAIMLMVATTVVFTIMASAILGAGGSLLQTGTLAVLADRHNDQRDRALIEANVGASAAAILAPIFFGFLKESSLSWRIGLLAPVLALVIFYGIYHREPFPDAPSALAPDDHGAKSRLPRRCWLLCALTGIVVGAEFCVVFYGAPLLNTAHGMTIGGAALAISLFYTGELLGRLIGSKLIQRTSHGVALVFCSLVVAMTAFLAFWLARSEMLALSALFLTGVGMANLFPVSLSLAVNAAPGRTNLVTARAQLLVGCTMMIAPVALGALADQFGIFSAFSIEVILIALAAFLLAVGQPLPPGISNESAGGKGAPHPDSDRPPA
jgi:fucose permease